MSFIPKYSRERIKKRQKKSDDKLEVVFDTARFLINFLSELNKNINHEQNS
ncbi:hypothetical protein [Lactococcus petauri]|uniref:hypothetical protein n=1 Tax=Lactococcus petauri TaxID=1940789 RepID=UPI003854F45E